MLASANLFDDGPVDEPVSVTFQTFWQLYPRKVGRFAAEREWRRVARTAGTAEAIVHGLERLMTTQTWRRAMAEQEMPHVLHARTFLHQRRWEDEITGPHRTSWRQPWICHHDPRCPHEPACQIVTSRSCPHSPSCADRSACLDKLEQGDWGHR